MGQRSQIFVRYEEKGTKKLIARYYQWNFGETMISRARYSIEWLKEHYIYPWSIQEKLYRIMDTNFDYIDVVKSSDIIKEYVAENWQVEYSLTEFLFQRQDNNDGKLLIDIDESGEVKFAFLNRENKKPYWHTIYDLGYRKKLENS